MPAEVVQDLKDWNIKRWSDIVKENKLRAEKPRPVPKLVSLSQSGVLRIRFDKQMIPPVDLDLIPETKYVFIDQLTEE